jgi:hypothetical protein
MRNDSRGKEVEDDANGAYLVCRWSLDRSNVVTLRVKYGRDVVWKKKFARDRTLAGNILSEKRNLNLELWTERTGRG